MFDRTSDEARLVVVHAQEEARAFGHPHIGTEHLLLGLLHGEADPSGQAIRAVGVDRAAVRARLVGLVGTSPAGPAEGFIPFTDRAKRVLVNGLRVTDRLGQSYIRAPQLLCALLEVRDGTAVRLLLELGVDVDGLAATAHDLAIQNG